LSKVGSDNQSLEAIMSDALFALPASFATYVLLTQFLTKHKIKKEMFEVVEKAPS